MSAPALPAGAFAPFLDDSQTPRASGMLRDVDLAFARDVRGTLRLDGVAFALSSSHRLHGLHGNLIFGQGGVGSKKIAGSLDRVPFDAIGEVHDVAQPFGWLADGSRDLRAFEKLIREIADEPKLTSVHLDTTAPGIGFALYTMQTERGPLAVNVLAIDPSEPTLRFDTAIAEDHVISNGERTSAMGTRTGAVAGVNGDYFDIGRTYQPQGMLERGGQIVRGPVERAALVIDKGNHVRFDLFRIVGSVRAGDRTYPVTQLKRLAGRSGDGDHDCVRQDAAGRRRRDVRRARADGSRESLSRDARDRCIGAATRDVRRRVRRVDTRVAACRRDDRRRLPHRSARRRRGRRNRGRTDSRARRRMVRRSERTRPGRSATIAGPSSRSGGKPTIICCSSRSTAVIPTVRSA